PAAGPLAEAPGAAGNAGPAPPVRLGGLVHGGAAPWVPASARPRPPGGPRAPVPLSSGRPPLGRDPPPAPPAAPPRPGRSAGRPHRVSAGGPARVTGRLRRLGGAERPEPGQPAVP